ncbi:molybdopterin converting factor small subunit [Agromyces terreus]|uniref:Molybdopterin converting factor small subunit n=1 Tax=Agromyces terreus TaxID=424795 RepID=A0A9X2H532_9MICO|nr:MoaD/ThiS family protein [Agromyces terreus]MCP2369554.1 molybdopterin converting factor small subunit [Agromyces terreus]
MTAVTVRYFAAAAEAAGREEELVELEGAATVGDLREILLARYGAPMERVLRSGSFLVGGRVERDPAAALTERVDILPPFAGG